MKSKAQSVHKVICYILAFAFGFVAVSLYYFSEPYIKYAFWKFIDYLQGAL